MQNQESLSEVGGSIFQIEVEKEQRKKVPNEKVHDESERDRYDSTS